MSAIKRIFLVGNPNVGKSVVFSRLTGIHVVSSNYPGTTVEIVKGSFEFDLQSIEVIDLPGTYSLEPTSKAEEVAVNVLTQAEKNECVVVNVIDATNLERNLYLTLQLLEANFSVIVCLNMCDDTTHRGITIDTEKLQTLLGAAVIPTCAVTGVGIKALVRRIPHGKTAVHPQRSHQQRWLAIGEILSAVQRLSHRHHTIREIIEDASIRPLSGLIIAAGVIFLAFKIVRLIGESIITYISDPIFFNWYKPILAKLNMWLAGNHFIQHLLIGDLIQGEIDFKQSLGLLTTAPYIEFAMVLPYIISFYLVLSLLEDIGFLPRFAMLLDGILHRLGLHGFAIIPVLLGFGCNVPGILATRVLESKRERFIAATLISIGVPCVPLQAMIFGLLGGFSGWYVGGVYLVLLCVWLILGLVLNKILKGNSPEFLLEIPPYRMPPLNALAQKMYYRVKGFIIEALPVVFAGVLVVNVLLYFKLFDFVTKLFAPVMVGLFGVPKEAVIALIVGFFRKDVAIGMLAPLGLSPDQLFICAVLLAISFPCIATFVVLLKELGWKYLCAATALMIACGLLIGAFLNISLAWL